MKLFTLLLGLISLTTSAKDFNVEYSPLIYSDISENIQGITHSKDYWFISNQFTIYRIPKSKKLIARNFSPSALKNYDTIKIPEKLRKLKYNHFGGISIYKNYLLVALERKTPLKILFFDQETLELEKIYDVPEHLESLSWVAAGENLIYFSENKLTPKHPLYIYDPTNDTLTTKTVSKSIKRIQGGTVNEQRRTLMLSSDTGYPKGGVYSVHLDNFYAQHEAGILYNNGFPAYLEIEGLTFKNPDKKKDIVLLMLDNNLFGDGFKFIHISNFW